MSGVAGSANISVPMLGVFVEFSRVAAPPCIALGVDDGVGDRRRSRRTVSGHCIVEVATGQRVGDGLERGQYAGHKGLVQDIHEDPVELINSAVNDSHGSPG